MSLQCGIIGLPNVGKSTIFNALSNAGATVENYPFCTIEPNIGIAQVPDHRIDTLAAIVNPQKITYPIVRIVDIAGLVKGAADGEGLGNQFLSHIREVNVIIHVLRAFSDSDVAHSYGSVDLVRDKEVVDAELILADLSTVEKQIIKAERSAKAGDKDSKGRAIKLSEMKSMLERGKPTRMADAAILDLASELSLLSAKPVIYVINVDDDYKEDGRVKEIREKTDEEGSELIIMSGKIESEIAQMEDDEKQLFLDELKVDQPALNRLIKTSYATLGLITFYTAGPKEVRGWTITKGSTAKMAAGAIHTDIEKGFIKAQITKYDDYVRLKSDQAIKEKGLMSVVGKDYIMKDGDIVYFMFR